VRAPKRRRQRPRTVVRPPPGLALEDVAQDVRYSGSPEHKDRPSFAGQPRPRADASIRDPNLAQSQSQLTDWLREAVRAGCIGAPWEGRFPRYIWREVGGVLYEARLVYRTTGEYKGYPLMPAEWPLGLGRGHCE